MPDHEQCARQSSICDALEITPELVRDKVLLDVGCGPTGRLAGLAKHKGSGTWIAMDPLLDHYAAMPEANLAGYDMLLSMPCEQKAIIGPVDVVTSINALDHGYDLGLALQNIYGYLRPGGKAILSFDCFSEPLVDITHPIRVSVDEATALIEATGFIVDRLHDTPAYEGRTNWGGGTHWHWRLSKP